MWRSRLLCQHFSTRCDDLFQLEPVRIRDIDERRSDRAGIDAAEGHTGLDQRDGIAGSGVAQPHERVEELTVESVDEFDLPFLECRVVGK